MTPHKHAALIKANLHRFIYRNGELLWADNFGPRARKGCVAGSTDTHGYRQVNLCSKSLFIHRIVWVMHNASLPEQIDHINRNRQDNRIENLRASNNMLNQHNASKRRDNTSGCVGVNQRDNRWHARISCNKKRIHLGVFDTFEQAKQAYLIAKDKYHEQVT